MISGRPVLTVSDSKKVPWEYFPQHVFHVVSGWLMILTGFYSTHYNGGLPSVDARRLPAIPNPQSEIRLFIFTNPQRRG